MWDKIMAYYYDPIRNNEFHVTFNVTHGRGVEDIWRMAKSEMWSAYEITNVDCWQYLAQGVSV